MPNCSNPGLTARHGGDSVKMDRFPRTSSDRLYARPGFAVPFRPFLLPALLLTAALMALSGRAAGASPAAGTSQGLLPLPVRQALSTSGIPPESVAIWVQGVDAEQPRLAFNAGQALNPASVMKLVTAFAAFERLGPAHSWSTRFVTRADVRDEVLQGDLHVVGGGDPVLGYERLWKLLRRLRAQGINRIAGDIVLDGSVLALPEHDPEAFDGRGLRPYNSGPHGLLLNYNTQQLLLFPGTSPGAPVTVVAEPPLAGVIIDNRLTTSPAACTLWYRDLDARIETGMEGDTHLRLLGSLPGSCGPRTWSAAPLSPAGYGTALVAALWQEVGGTLAGRVRQGHTPAGGRTLFSEDSPPLADVARDMNKWSSNVIARQLLATLSPADESDMVAGGARIAREQLVAAGIADTGLVIENGAGLSRMERIRAETLGRLLLTVWQRPWMPEYLATLPVAGVDGTARKRLAGSRARGQAHIKTGTLNGVRAIGGYVLDHAGRRHAVVMLINHPEAAAGQAAQDALLEWVWAGTP